MTPVDPYGRKLTGLRMAVTPRCNLRCIYCHHEGERGDAGEMDIKRATGIVRAAASLGLRTLKITGGEPLLRSDLNQIISSARSAAPFDISVTTNGILLAEKAEGLAQSGLDRVNVSLDSLCQERYRRITGAGEGDLDRVLAGIDAALLAELHPVKLNMVVLHENQAEIDEMIDLARRKGAVLQLIELMDIGRLGLGGDLAQVEADLARRADRTVTRELHRRRKYFLDGAEVEVVRPMDNTEFCAHCSRLRVTSDGRLKPCLLRSDNLVDVGCSDPEEIRQAILRANARRAPFFPHQAEGTKASCPGRNCRL
ncbi:MAG: molybdenum cofactor biosynthesis protein A [Methanosaeta sp. PtaB.Bin039]|nr:MAG: molybdenum cofactor biosynthesis protein A [Methanosaeta sp. PtaB.Bin039]OPY44573.1 MAG: molybdenum cofactor biosynthesis protein A [Methanosaeta sp. PtaU1.Bin028]HOT06437.1 GTP 3',8-cyclase MoaA [Methanotrichaceae archaeon]HQF16208.1 GTP 3',8-cyclase MoaA [Methanotrichaceae archaeon]HQI90944.1 GTP 3',8-cyclase MoaA [Methanotrichaceae archaeon]